jgi:hypothetical protein
MSRDELVASWKAMISASLEPDDTQLLHLWQDGRCAVCAFPDRLVEDHDWDTGLTRGFLCRSCNTREGFAGDDEPWATYRSNPPTSLLGLRIEYVNPFGGPTVRTQVSEEAKMNAAGKLHIPYVQLEAFSGIENEETV